MCRPSTRSCASVRYRSNRSSVTSVTRHHRARKVAGLLQQQLARHHHEQRTGSSLCFLDGGGQEHRRVEPLAQNGDDGAARTSRSIVDDYDRCCALGEDPAGGRPRMQPPDCTDGAAVHDDQSGPLRGRHQSRNAGPGVDLAVDDGRTVDQVAHGPTQAFQLIGGPLHAGLQRQRRGQRGSRQQGFAAVHQANREPPSSCIVADEPHRRVIRVEGDIADTQDDRRFVVVRDVVAGARTRPSARIRHAHQSEPINHRKPATKVLSRVPTRPGRWSRLGRDLQTWQHAAAGPHDGIDAR